MQKESKLIQGYRKWGDKFQNMNQSKVRMQTINFKIFKSKNRDAENSKFQNMQK